MITLHIIQSLVPGWSNGCYAAPGDPCATLQGAYQLSIFLAWVNTWYLVGFGLPRHSYRVTRAITSHKLNGIGKEVSQQRLLLRLLL